MTNSQHGRVRQPCGHYCSTHARRPDHLARRAVGRRGRRHPRARARLRPGPDPRPRGRRLLPRGAADPRASTSSSRRCRSSRAPRWPARSCRRPRAPGFAPGDRVAALVLLGGFAEYAVTQADLVFPLPDSLSFEQGAALPMNYLTAHFALRRPRPARRGRVGARARRGRRRRHRGHPARQGVRRRRSSPSRRRRRRARSPRRPAPTRSCSPTASGTPSRRPGGVDIVVDPVGGDRFTDSLRCLKADGRLLVIGFTAGEIPDGQGQPAAAQQRHRRRRRLGRVRAPAPGYIAGQWDALLPHLESGAIDPPIGATFALDDAADALLTLDERRATGKVLLTP